MFRKFLVSSDHDLQAFGAQLSEACVACKLSPFIYLVGDLGAGKTTLTRGFLHQRGHQGAVKSPTYTLVEAYDFQQGPVYHFDFYRINQPQECEEMGIRDYTHPGATCLVEWPQKAQGFLPAPTFTVSIEIVENDHREVTVNAHNPQAETCLDLIKGSDA